MLSNTQYNQFYERCRHSWCGRRIIRIIKYLLSCDPFRIKLKIKNEGSLHIKKRIIGKNNIITIAKGACLDGVFIRIQGSNNIIDIGSDTIMAQRTCIYMYGNNLELRIGDNCTFNHDCELLVQEDFSKIIIGNDCMFSHHINVRTSDAHPIYIIGTTQRANPAKSILIGSHVWIGANVIIQKGCKIGNGCVIGANSLLSHSSLENSNKSQQLLHNAIIAGIPGKVIKEGIYWARDFK